MPSSQLGELVPLGRVLQLNGPPCTLPGKSSPLPPGTGPSSSTQLPFGEHSWPVPQARTPFSVHATQRLAWQTRPSQSAESLQLSSTTRTQRPPVQASPLRQSLLSSHA